MDQNAPFLAPKALFLFHLQWNLAQLICSCHETGCGPSAPASIGYRILNKKKTPLLRMSALQKTTNFQRSCSKTGH